MSKCYLRKIKLLLLLLLLLWLRTHATFDVTCFPAFVWASKVISIEYINSYLWSWRCMSVAGRWTLPVAPRCGSRAGACHGWVSRSPRCENTAVGPGLAGRGNLSWTPGRWSAARPDSGRVGGNINYCEIINICWTFNFVDFMCRAYHKFKIPMKYLFTLVIVHVSWKPWIQVSTNMSNVIKPWNLCPWN